MSSWLTSTLTRHFPATPARPNRLLRMEVARNEWFSFQLGLRLDAPPAVSLPLPVQVSVEAEAPVFWEVRVRRVGYVPVAHRNWRASREDSDAFDHLPGYVPDPLFDEEDVTLPPLETQAFWFSVRPRRAVSPGSYEIIVVTHSEGAVLRRHKVRVQVRDVTIRKRRDFRVTNWFYCDALLTYYDCEPFDEKFWKILPAYLRNLAEHGQDTLYVPLLTQATDGVKRPTQLLNITRSGRARYAFDWRDVRRFLRVAKEAGISHFEWPHLFTQWGASHAIRVYQNQGRSERLLWPPKTGATSTVYRTFLEQLLPELHAFLKKEKLLSKSFFHVSDEPHEEHLENYRAAREMLRDVAPWMRAMDALSNVAFAREGLTDVPVPAIDHAMEFIDSGIPSWCYYCCSQRGAYLNRLLDTPLAKIRMNGWLFYRFGVKGFLHWSANYWFGRGTRQLIDPFTVQDAGSWPNWPYGDTFLIYPGPSGPIDSIRWEVFAESLQDYALLQTVNQDRNGNVFAKLKDFQDFPKSEVWIQKERGRLLKESEKTKVTSIAFSGPTIGREPPSRRAVANEGKARTVRRK